MKKLLTVAEAGTLLGLSEKAIRQRVFRGQMPYRKLGKRVLIPADEPERFVAALPGRTAEDAAIAVEERL